DQGMAGAGCPGSAADAAAEPAGQRGTSAAHGVWQPGRGPDAGGPDRRADEHYPAGCRGHGRAAHRGRRGADPPGQAALTLASYDGQVGPDRSAVELGERVIAGFTDCPETSATRYCRDAVKRVVALACVRAGHSRPGSAVPVLCEGPEG